MWITEGHPIAQTAEPKEFHLNNFTDESIRAFQRTVANAVKMSQEILPIYIQSYGGDAHIMSNFISEMDTCRETFGIKFATIVGGCAMSAGALLFCYGDEGMRFISDSGSLMLHGLQIGMDGRVPDMKGYTKRSEEMEDHIFRKISKHLGKKDDFLQKELELGHHTDRYLNAKECVQKGLASQVAIPQFLLSVVAGFTIIAPTPKAAKKPAAKKKVVKKPVKKDAA